ncbi:MAG: hypothetical protein OEM28_00125 [Nitrosopumilus sp.]|nr:hypothetical protein [Nitrosopumilus sp.]MDH3487745.1 hypothetical protein [Nitrosopumilus sp.]
MSVVSVSDILRKRKTGNVKSFATSCIFGMMLSLSSLMFDVSAFAESTQTTVMKLDDETSLEKTSLSMNIPETNTLPWGTIKGKVNDPSQGYPVIIQIFKADEDVPIHVAQVSLKGDNSFEYRFRLLSIDEDNIIHFFEGDYNVKIFKVINTLGDNLESI